jgi:AraC-like DNA-binding protein
VANSEDEYISNNAIEVLSVNDDKVSKEEAIEQLKSNDEFEQYKAVKFLVTFGAKDCLQNIVNVMKKSSLSENIAAEIPFLVDLETLLEKDFELAVLVLCNIVNAIPEIIQPAAAIDYNLLEIFENLYYNNLTSSSALLLRMAKEQFATLEENEEYLTQDDKQFLKKLILSVTKMMNHQVVTVTQVADTMCMSPKTLNRRVQYLTGESAKRNIVRIQLEQAKIMLLQNLDIPVVEIGNRCGFDDHSSFTRTFTQNVGISPSDYRLNRGKC